MATCCCYPWPSRFVTDYLPVKYKQTLVQPNHCSSHASIQERRENHIWQCCQSKKIKKVLSNKCLVQFTCFHRMTALPKSSRSIRLQNLILYCRPYSISTCSNRSSWRYSIIVRPLVSNLSTSSSDIIISLPGLCQSLYDYSQSA